MVVGDLDMLGGQGSLGTLKLPNSVWFAHMCLSRERVQGLHEPSNVSGFLQNVNHWSNPFLTSPQGAVEKVPGEHGGE